MRCILLYRSLRSRTGSNSEHYPLVDLLSAENGKCSYFAFLRNGMLEINANARHMTRCRCAFPERIPHCSEIL